MYDDIATEDLTRLLAERQVQARAVLGIPEPDADAAFDADTRSAVDTRTRLHSGSTAPGADPGPDPHSAARQAVRDGIARGLSHGDAMAEGVGQIMRAAAKGDPRVRYRGRVEPGV